MAPDELRNHFVYSIQHDAWWREGSRGYTTDINQAGFYTEGEAKEIAETGDGEIAVLAGLALAIVRLERYRVKEWTLVEYQNTLGSDPRCALSARGGADNG